MYQWISWGRSMYISVHEQLSRLTWRKWTEPGWRAEGTTPTCGTGQTHTTHLSTIRGWKNSKQEVRREKTLKALTRSVYRVMKIVASSQYPTSMGLFLKNTLNTSLSKAILKTISSPYTEPSEGSKKSQVSAILPRQTDGKIENCKFPTSANKWFNRDVQVPVIQPQQTDIWIENRKFPRPNLSKQMI